MAGLHRRISPLAAALALAVVLGGCSTMGTDTSTMTPAQRELHERTARFNETVATGAGVGCAVGAGIGWLISRDAVGAGAGCAAGGAAGFGAGYYVASRNERYDTREQAANARIASARKESADLARTAELASQVTRENRAKLAQLDSRYRAGQLSAAQYRREAEAARNDLKTIQTASQKAGEVSRTMQSDAQQSRDNALRQEATRVDAAQRQLQQSASELEAALNRVPAA